MDHSLQGGRPWQEGLSTSLLTTDFNIRLKMIDIIFVFGSVVLCIVARSFLKKSIRYSPYEKKCHPPERSYWNFLGLSQKFQVILQKNMPSVSGARKNAIEPADRNFPSYDEFLAQYPSYGYDGEIDALAADFPSRYIPSNQVALVIELQIVLRHVRSNVGKLYTGVQHSISPRTRHQQPLAVCD